MANCTCTGCAVGQLRCLPVRRFLTLLAACVVSAFLGAFASVYVIELHLSRSHSSVAHKVKEVLRGQRIKGDDIADDEVLAQEASSASFVEGISRADERESERASAHARALGIFTVGSSAGMGCFPVDSTQSIALDADSCNGNRCPDCFINTGATDAITLTITKCTSAKYVGSQGYTGVREYMFVNADTDTAMAVTDGVNTYWIPPMNMIKASCYSGGAPATYHRLFFPANYGVSQNSGANNVGTCPDACDAVRPKKASNTADFTVVEHWTVAERALMTTAKVGYLCNQGPSADVQWSWMFDPSSVCPVGCDATAPIKYPANVAAPAFSTVNFLAVNQYGYLTALGPTENIDYARLGKLLGNNPGTANIDWGWLFNPASKCPAGCDFEEPTNTYGSKFATVKFLPVDKYGYLTVNGPDADITWTNIFDATTRCPKGCDTENPIDHTLDPVDGSGTAFANTGTLTTSQKTMLFASGPTTILQYAMAECAADKFVCVQ